MRARGAVDVNAFAVDRDLGAVRRHHAGEDLDQRRLAGAVLSHQRVDFSARHIEVDTA